MSPSGAQNIFFALPCGSLGPKILFSCFRVEVLDQKSFFRASVWKFRAKNFFFTLPCESVSISPFFMLYLNSAALFLVRYFYILKWHFWNLSIDMGIFWGSWFLHNHEIPHPNQWGSMKNHKKMIKTVREIISLFSPTVFVLFLIFLRIT